MFDNSEEDKDLASQVEKGASSSSDKDDEVVGSPVTPEKLDPSMDLDRKAREAATEALKTEDKKES